MKKLLFVLICISIICACSKTETIPFEVEFIGSYTSVTVDEECGDSWMHVINDGEGTGTIGSFTNHFDFCAEINQGNYPGNHMISHFIATNGDTLHVRCAGKVVEGRLDDHPEYVVSYWRDPFEILGGSGRFEGATGEGVTDDYNSNKDENSHHSWKGTITLIKK